MRTRRTALACLLLAGALHVGCGAEERAAAPEPPPAVPRAVDAAAALESRVEAEVVVYTAAWCGWCQKTLAWLDEHGVAYENRDIEVDPRHRQELIAKSGGTGIPLVEIGATRIQGFAPDRMSELLGLAP